MLRWSSHDIVLKQPQERMIAHISFDRSSRKYRRRVCCHPCHEGLISSGTYTCIHPAIIGSVTAGRTASSSHDQYNFSVDGISTVNAFLRPLKCGRCTSCGPLQFSPLGRSVEHLRASLKRLGKTLHTPFVNISLWVLPYMPVEKGEFPPCLCGKG